MEYLLQHDLDPKSSPEYQPDPILTKEQKAYEKKLKQYEKEKARWEYFQANKERLIQNQVKIEAYNTSSYQKHQNHVKGDAIGAQPMRKDLGLLNVSQAIDAYNKVIYENFPYMDPKAVDKLPNTGIKGSLHFKLELIQDLNAADGKYIAQILKLNITAQDQIMECIPKLEGVYMCKGDAQYLGGNTTSGITIYDTYKLRNITFPKKPTPPKKPITHEAPKAKVVVKQELTDLKAELLPNSLSKEEKAYEKKLKAYEKNLERYAYFLNNKERILNNKKITDKNNASRVNGYVETPSTGIYATGYNQWTVDHKLGMIEKEKVLSTIAEYTATNPFTDETKALINSQKYALEKFNSGVKLNPSDKKYGFLPTYIGSWITVYLDDESKHQVHEWRMFNSFDIPKKPTPPEKPQIKESLADLKKEVLTSKEMNISRRTYGDTVPTKLEVIIDGQTMTIEKETYDLYIQYKATRKERPHDLDLSFDHFKATYLDKHPKFMRKEK